VGIEIGRAENAEHRDEDLTHLFLGAAIGLLRGSMHLPRMADAPPPVARFMREVSPAAPLALELAATCDCGRPGCSGVSGEVKAVVAIGWEAMACLIGQFEAWLETIPQHQQDQAAALRAEQAAEIRRAIADARRDSAAG
jgi:hypothetical protein